MRIPFDVSLVKRSKGNGQDHDPMPFTYKADRLMSMSPRACWIIGQKISKYRGVSNEDVADHANLAEIAHAGVEHDTCKPFEHMQHAL